MDIKQILKENNIMIISTAGRTVEVSGNNISISESITKKQKTIPINNVISIQIKKPGLIGGYIYFQTVGGLSNSSMKTVNDYIKDENTIVLNSKKKYEAALQIKEYIEKIQHSTNDANQISGADELTKYKQLLDEGVLTQEEFNLKKKQLLGL